ncbi:DUF6048 family protein [Coprobacter tertius]|uniref:DUF6048 family protein n=1 Tax=Coprobacter tertius TaxID=2944915 RepID=A0ABT1MFP6_9BACT|nr:DUF6048 family protein [Coprobacter tertius]MCP9611462.1 DUF6048 family protein [Coprobacter tertius]
MNKYIIISVVMLLCVFVGKAQNRNTPASTTSKTASAEKKEATYTYPLFNGLVVGVDLYNPVAKLFGQKYSNYEASLELDLHNRFFPIWEIGIGSAKSTPEDMNFTYRGKAALYNRIGMNYNIKYNNKTLDGVYAGIRYGFSTFNYDITDIRLESSYWDPENPVIGEITGQHSRAQWIEALVGIRVKLYKGLMMGWTVRYKWKLNVKNNFQSTPWFIPGYGTSNNPVSFTYSIYYRIPFSGKKSSKEK